MSAAGGRSTPLRRGRSRAWLGHLPFAVVALVGVALTTTWWVLLALVAAPATVRAVTLVLGERATGPALIPVLQLTGVAELLYAAGIFAGVVVGVAVPALT